MSWIKEEDMRAIRQQADIVDVLSHYLSLNKKGKNYMAVCPFHDDHDPSLSISTDKQIFKCFVCGTGGNVFTFVQKIENISFPEAVVKVAEMIGYPLRIEAPVMKEQSAEQPYYDLMQSYIQFCAYELQSEDGFLCMQYLQKRHIHEDIRKRFEIGYAPMDERSLHYFKAKNYATKDLLDTGLVHEGQQGMRATFFNRLMIPIHDDQGHPVGFTARKLSDMDQGPKYINTAQTKIYEKGNLIFNYHRAKNFARKNERVILVEGAMDVLAFEKAEIHESIACLGTACTKAQILLIKALKVPVIVCYDGDRSGRNATYKFSVLALENNVAMQIVKNPTEKDPDEIFENGGASALKNLVHKTISLAEFYLDYLSRKYDLENYEDKRKFVQIMEDCIRKTCTDFEKSTYFARIKEMTGFDLSLNEPKNTSRPEVKYRKVPMLLERPKDGRKQAEQSCLNMILLSKEAALRFKEEIGFFKDEICNQLSYYCYDIYRYQNRIDFDELISKIDEEDVRNFLLALLSDPFRMTKYDEKFFLDSVNKIRECTYQEQIDLINQKIIQSVDNQEKLELARQKREWIIKKNGLRKEG